MGRALGVRDAGSTHVRLSPPAKPATPPIRAAGASPRQLALHRARRAARPRAAGRRASGKPRRRARSANRCAPGPAGRWRRTSMTARLRLERSPRSRDAEHACPSRWTLAGRARTATGVVRCPPARSAEPLRLHAERFPARRTRKARVCHCRYWRSPSRRRSDRPQQRRGSGTAGWRSRALGSCKQRLPVALREPAARSREPRACGAAEHVRQTGAAGPERRTVVTARGAIPEREVHAQHAHAAAEAGDIRHAAEQDGRSRPVAMSRRRALRRARRAPGRVRQTGVRPVTCA